MTAASHANDPSGTIGDILAFDDAIRVALDYAKENQDTIVRKAYNRRMQTVDLV